MKEEIYVHVCGGPWGIGGYKYIDDDGIEQMGYGFYHPKNPNDFFPDQECCSEQEIENWKAARAAWNKTNGENK